MMRRRMVASNEQPPVRTAIPLRMDAIAAFCKKWDVVRFALFGSVLRDDFRPDSDVDVIVTFAPSARPTLFSLSGMSLELEDLFGHPVDLLESRGVEQMRNPYLKPQIQNSARVVYAR